MIVTGGLGLYFWGTWWCVPFFVVYGVLYGSGGDWRWHECGHGTAFRTQWKNDVVYQLACFMMVRNPVVWRWSHARHHTDTIIVGRDPEIITMRPAGPAPGGPRSSSASCRPQALMDDAALCRRPPDRRREGLHPRERAAKVYRDGAHLDGDLPRRDRRLLLDGLDPAAC